MHTGEASASRESSKGRFFRRGFELSARGPHLCFRRPRKESLRDISTSRRYALREVMAVRDIGKNIKDLREQKGLTQDALAEQLFVTRQTVSNYETGRTRPDVEMLMRIAGALDSPVDAVLYGLPVPQNRRRARRRMAAGGGLLALTAALAAILHPVAAQVAASRYLTTPADLVGLLLDPAALLLLGWCALQATELLFGAKPLKDRPWVKPVRVALLALLAAGAALLCPYVIWALGTLFRQTAGPGTGMTFQAWPLYTGLLGPLMRLNLRFPALYSLVGAALWALGFPRAQGRATATTKQ